MLPVLWEPRGPLAAQSAMEAESAFACLLFRARQVLHSELMTAFSLKQRRARLISSIKWQEEKENSQLSLRGWIRNGMHGINTSLEDRQTSLFDRLWQILAVNGLCSMEI